MHGEVVYLFAFDVASEIATARVGQILAANPAPFELRSNHNLPKDLPLYRPLACEAQPLECNLGDRTVRRLVRIYDLGVVSIAFRIRFEVDSLVALAPFHGTTLTNGQSIAAAARALCAEVCDNLRDAMVQPAPLGDPEAYTVFCLTALDGQTDAGAWLGEQKRPIAELLSESPPDKLSEMQIGEVLRIMRSYTKTDVVVIDWDAALVVDLEGYIDDVLYVLELANLQLEEYKVIDQRLDRYLDRVYDVFNRRQRGVFSTYTQTLAALKLIRVDLTKLNDEVTHISKFFGDWYLARIYVGAAERFYLSHWRQSVEQRLGQLDDLYSMVNADINNRRMVWLELLIVLFFAIDLLMLWFKK
jgi:hypothetical protein